MHSKTAPTSTLDQSLGKPLLVIEKLVEWNWKAVKWKNIFIKTES